jgi:uncharacterized phage protein (TIGR02218 family)
MKPTNATLNALLASRQFIIANAYTFTLIDGTVLRYTDGDTNITYSGNTYSAGGQTGPYTAKQGQRPVFKWVRGLQVQTCTFDIIPGSATVNSQTFISAIRLGLFDGAQVSIDRFYMATYGNTSAGLLNIFLGKIAEVKPGRDMINITLNGFTDILNQTMPRNLYQAGCVNTLFDASCTLNQASFATNGTASTGCTVSSINATLAQATGYFNQGKIKFTSGANNTFWRSVKSYTNGSPSVITLITPLPTAPSNGDSFTIYPGCDKTLTTCTSKFSNQVNFRGFPFIPENSTAI